MRTDTSAIPIDPCKHCGAGAPVDVHFCPRCDRILTLGRHGDYFTFFGLRRRLRLDVNDMEQRFRALSRLFHPDYFHNATSTERLASLERASYLNDAFRTLRDPMARLEYLLKLEGFTPKESHDATTKVPQGLLEKVFELNEELEAIQDMRAEGASASAIALRLHAARQPIESSLARHEEDLEALMSEHDACLEAGDTEGRHAALMQLRTLMLERTYLMNLLTTVRREAGAGEAAAS
jgi:molecular chaperone HscB